MCSRFLSVAAIVAFALAGNAFAAPPLKVCADPDNLPFSSRAATGFDNKVASLLGAALGRHVEFTWGRMGRGFIREYLDKGKCEVLVGVPVGMRGVLVTRPYYRSSYVFVTRPGVRFSSLDDDGLKNAKIGVQVLDDDYAPPARALSRRGLTENIVAFEVEQPARILRAVANRAIDVAIIWGPTAGYYGARSGRSLHIERVTPELDPPALPLAYDMAIGVRKGDGALFQQVNAALGRLEPQIQRILRSYNVPVLPERNTLAAGGQRP